MAEEQEQMEVVEQVAVEETRELDTTEALRIVLKKASVFDGLRRGLHE